MVYQIQYTKIFDMIVVINFSVSTLYIRYDIVLYQIQNQIPSLHKAGINS